MSKSTIKRLGMEDEFSSWVSMKQNAFDVGSRVYLKPTRWFGYEKKNGLKEGDKGIITELYMTTCRVKFGKINNVAANLEDLRLIK